MRALHRLPTRAFTWSWLRFGVKFVQRYRLLPAWWNYQLWIARWDTGDRPSAHAVPAAVVPRIVLLQTGELPVLDREELLAQVSAQPGAWFSFVGHEDKLHDQAMARLATAIVTEPGAQLVYGDQDGMDPFGLRHSPYFKPALDRELLLAQDYLSNGTFVSASALNTALATFDEAEIDLHALMLAIVATTPDAQVVHVAGVLYHRALPWSGLAYPLAPPGPGSQSAVAGFLAQRAVAADIIDTADGGWRVRRRLPTPLPRVSVIIPTRDQPVLLRRCVDSLLAITDYPDFEVLVVDNGSVLPETRTCLRALARDSRVRVLDYAAPFNFSAINNHAAAIASGDVLGLLNDDTEVMVADWMRELTAQALRPEIGAVGTMLLYPDGRIQHAGVLVGLNGVAGHPYRGQRRDYPGQAGRLRASAEVSAVTAACLFVRKAVYQAAGGLDEAFAVAFNDVDFCLRLRQMGYRNLWTPHAPLTHHESATRGNDAAPEQRRRLDREIALFHSRWQHLLLQDPAYHPALDLHGEPYTLDLNR